MPDAQGDGQQQNAHLEQVAHALERDDERQVHDCTGSSRGSGRSRQRRRQQRRRVPATQPSAVKAELLRGPGGLLSLLLLLLLRHELGRTACYSQPSGCASTCALRNLSVGRLLSLK